jgi:DNA-binding transcriptional regulator YhcF (GntR family)
VPIAKPAQYGIGGSPRQRLVAVAVAPLLSVLFCPQGNATIRTACRRRQRGVWYTTNQQKICPEVDVADTQLKIAPIGEGLSLKARAYDALKTAIMNMNIYADEAELRLDERDLSQRFGVSRTPLREALAQLDQEGLVKIVARRGIFIVRKTKAEILDMITVWAALESMAARLATQHASAAEMTRLHPLVDKFSQDEIARKLGEYSEASTCVPSASVRSPSRTAPSARSSTTRRSSPRWRHARPSARSAWCASTRCACAITSIGSWISTDPGRLQTKIACVEECAMAAEATAGAIGITRAAVQ